jgi:hypothetical protein
MSQTPTPSIPAVRLILEKAKGIFPNPYTWQINAWEYMFAPKSQDVLVIAGMGSGKSMCFKSFTLSKRVVSHLLYLLSLL